MSLLTSQKHKHRVLVPIQVVLWKHNSFRGIFVYEQVEIRKDGEHTPLDGLATVLFHWDDWVLKITDWGYPLPYMCESGVSVALQHHQVP